MVVIILTQFSVLERVKVQYDHILVFYCLATNHHKFSCVNIIYHSMVSIGQELRHILAGSCAPTGCNQSVGRDCDSPLSLESIPKLIS